jgi:Flp pilus assembly protein TadG
MSLRHRLAALLHDVRGAVLVEFALIGPALIVMLFGVFQTAIWMQNHNAVRSVASDVARQVMIQYQRNNALSTDQIRGILISQATAAPYLLDPELLDAQVNEVDPSRVTGATEFELDITYEMPNFLPLVEIDDFDINYVRPVFVVQPS